MTHLELRRWHRTISMISLGLAVVAGPPGADFALDSGHIGELIHANIHLCAHVHLNGVTQWKDVYQRVPFVPFG